MGNTPDKYLGQIKQTDLKGKVSLVTGANTGIGYITARELARMGAKVFVGAFFEYLVTQAIQRAEAKNVPTKLSSK